jgi:putative methionine-R-sulfoxide reductase with GAF domain
MDHAYIDAAVQRLFDSEPTFDWVGVYAIGDDRLILGPFRGQPTEHTTIPLGEGVCGSVAVKGETEVVPDVRQRPGHIACSLSTRSEVVAPIIREGQVLGVLDIDSDTPDAFGEREIGLVEEVARAIGEHA